MAAFEKEITIAPELRPCYVGDKPALFHRWVTREDAIITTAAYMDAETIADLFKTFQDHGIVLAGFDFDKQTKTFAIVEYDDGEVAEVEPSRVKFDDKKMQEYAFCRRPMPHTEFKIRAENEMLNKRILYLLRSDVVREYDEWDAKKDTYKNDLAQLDEMHAKYKTAFEILKSCTTCNGCVAAGMCDFVAWGERVVYNCPHYKARDEVKK